MLSTMIRKLLLCALCILALASCRKKDEEKAPQPCPECFTFNHNAYLRLMDAGGQQNLVYGPGATLPKDSISFWDGDKQLRWLSSTDSATAKGMIILNLVGVPSATVTHDRSATFLQKVTLKIKTAAGLKSILLTIYSESVCCDGIVRELFTDNAATPYKPVLFSASPHGVIAIPIRL